MIRLFVGLDPREAIGLHVFIQSVLEHASEPVSITPLSGRTDGTNAFTLARFMVPSLCHFSGLAVFMDGADMLMRCDLRELVDLADGRPVQVVKHHYNTKHPRKYVGTEMEADNQDYPRKNWSSVVVWNCGHVANRALTRSFVESQDGSYLHRFGWLTEREIGELPTVWNWLADEYGENPEAKVVHWTAGAPFFSHYAEAPHADEWKKTLRSAQRGLW